jgi:bifunctional UDP-N-acetylglucosamine pyrophosphorylase / glucosamine-1-phosphate N-acetyltransferase
MTKIVILAAGQGKRMGLDYPKVLARLNDKPIIKYLLDSVVASKIDEKPVIVVSPAGKDLIKEELGDYNLEYAIQEKQLGTGHAVLASKESLSKHTDKLIVLFGDTPFISQKSLAQVAQKKIDSLLIMSSVLPNYNSWYNSFLKLGRIIRNKEGKIIKIVEFKDASKDEKEVLEINVGVMAFNYSWLLSNIEKLKNNNKQNEYYLTDLASMSFEQKKAISSVIIEPEEAVGINDPEALKMCYNLL